MIASTDHDEARGELFGMLDGSLGHVPLAPLVELLASSYVDGGWEMLRDAALALRRRALSAEVEQLEIAKRPERRAVLGPYRTRRAGETPRPYRTHLHSLVPLHVSCDCPDYLKGGLGVCKHGIAVLHELGGKPRAVRPRELPEVADIRRMFSDLKVEPRADGGVRIDATPQAAQTLGALFAGMATLLEQAARAPQAPS